MGLRLLPCGFDPGGNVGCAYNERIQAGGHAENVRQSGLIEQAVKVLPLGQFDSVFGA